MSIIETRHSIRVFLNQQVEQEKVYELLKAGMSAPSSKNKKPWQFIAVNAPEQIQAIQACHKNWQVLKTACQLIIVCGDLEQDERIPHMLMACSAANQNILLKAHELGLGAVWLGCYPDEERMGFLKTFFNLPDSIIPLAVIPIGYYEKKQSKQRVWEQDKVHFGKWGNHDVTTSE